MASNFIQKNVIFGQQQFNSIPFDNIEKLNIQADPGGINNLVVMNNTYKQMIQNDMYVSKELEDKKNNIDGPKSNDENAIYDGPNGYKFYKFAEGDPYIYQKVDIPTKDSFDKLVTEDDIEFIAQQDNQKILYSNSKITYQSDQDFRNLKLTILKYHYDIEKYQKGIESESDYDDVYINGCSKSTTGFFCGGINGSGKIFRYVDDGLCFLSCTEEGNWVEKTDEYGNLMYVGYYLIDCGVSEGSDIVAVEFNERTKQLVYATINNVVLCTVDEDLKIISRQIIHNMIDDRVVGIKFINETEDSVNQIIVLTKNGMLYYSKSGSSFIGKELQSIKKKANIGFNLGKDVYYANTEGLFNKHAGKKISSNIYFLVYQNDEIAILCTKNGNKYEIHTFNGEQINKTLFDFFEIRPSAVFCIGKNLIGALVKVNNNYKIYYNKTSNIKTGGYDTVDIGEGNIEDECVWCRNISGHPYVCYSKIGNNNKRTVGYVKVEQGNTIIDDQTTILTNTLKEKIESKENGYIQQRLVGNNTILVYTTDNGTIIRDYGVSEKIIYGFQCLYFIQSYGKCYLFSNDRILIFSGMAESPANITQYETIYLKITDNNGNKTSKIDAVSISDTHEQDGNQIKYIVIQHDGRTDLLTYNVAKGDVKNNGSIKNFSYRSGCDVANIGNTFVQIDKQNNVKTHYISRETQKIDINERLQGIFSDKTIKSFSFPGYKKTGEDIYDIITYINTDKAYNIRSHINNGEGGGSSISQVQETNYKYAHIETANSNAGVFVNQDLNAYVKYNRFNSGWSEEIPNEEELLQKEINSLQEKYIDNQDYLNSITAATDQIGSVSELMFIGSRCGKEITQESETQNVYIIDSVYTAYRRSSQDKVIIRKTDFKNRFSVSGTTYSFIETQVSNKEIEIAINQNSKIQFTNGSGTGILKGNKILMYEQNGKTISVYSVDISLTNKQKIKTITLQNNIIGMSRYSSDSIVAIDTKCVYVIGESGVLNTWNYYIENSGQIFGVFCDDVKETDKTPEYVYNVYNIGMQTLFFDGSAQHGVIIECNNYMIDKGSYCLQECQIQQLLNMSGDMLVCPTSDVFIIHQIGSSKITAINHEDGEIINKVETQTIDGVEYDFSKLVMFQTNHGIEIKESGGVVSLEMDYPIMMKFGTQWRTTCKVNGKLKTYNIEDQNNARCLFDIDDVEFRMVIEDQIYEVSLPHKNTITLEHDTVPSEKFESELLQKPDEVTLSYDGKEYVVIHKNGNHDSVSAKSISVSTKEKKSIIGDLQYYNGILIPNGIYDSDSHKTLVCYTKNGTTDLITVTIVNSNGIVDITESIDIRSNMDLQFLQYNNSRGMYYIAYGNDSSAFILNYTGYGSDKVYLYLTRTPEDYGKENIGKGVDIERISQNNFLLVFENTLINYTFERDDGEIYDWEYIIMDAESVFGPISRFNNSSSNMYLIGDGNNIKTSIDTIVWTTQYTIGKNETQNDSVTRIYQKTERDIMCILKTEQEQNYRGQIYKSIYKYNLINNTQKFTESDAVKLFDEMKEDIDNTIIKSVELHQENMHNVDGNIDILNDMLSSAPIFPEDFTEKNITQDKTLITAKTDYVKSILTGNSDDGCVRAWIKNTANGNEKNSDNYTYIQDVTYIAKCWSSGIIDLFINIPTTYTYYIPHIRYAGNCTMYDSKVTVNGRSLTSKIQGNYTTIRLDILSTYFHIDAVFENTIKGSSLPLKIFQDQQAHEDEGKSSELFHSFMEPSVSEFIDPTNMSTKNDMYSIKYYCFGTDEQNIQLRFYDSTGNFDKRYRTIIYHGAGGTTEYGDETITQRIIEGDEPKLLFNNVFSNGTNSFIGWTANINQTQNADFTKKYISYDDPDVIFMNNRLHLYAVWTGYQFGDYDTIIQVSSKHNKDSINIEKLNIIPNLEVGGTNMKDNVIIDWDR